MGGLAVNGWHDLVPGEGLQVMLERPHRATWHELSGYIKLGI